MAADAADGGKDCGQEKGAVCPAAEVRGTSSMMPAETGKPPRSFLVKRISGFYVKGDLTAGTSQTDGLYIFMESCKRHNWVLGEIWGCQERRSISNCSQDEEHLPGWKTGLCASD